ncbi:hypothetical protein [Cytobacillus oceanisediminis]|uniref:hypothetical protein n=1 Tax=Cytobacillus oceanisediminis TaxID=665099 RepID=UPI001FB2B0AD|nr:hypothetical protein [Cytobacillus oceanisediminis]UOE57306.1 hypothetical protein IRB79_11405 [Cytobacillus oceanisediminis]
MNFIRIQEFSYCIMMNYIFLIQKKEDISYLKSEVETIELDITKLRNRTNPDFSIDFVLYWEDKESEHLSIIEILEKIEEEHFS